MLNECSNCGGALAENQLKCPYCGTIAENNSNQALLDELISVKRRYEIARARCNKIALDELIADDYLTTEADVPEAIYGSKQEVLNYATPDQNFFSYSVADEELIARTSDTAAFSSIGCFTHHNMPTLIYENGIAVSYYRTTVSFVRRDERWQMKNFREIPVDENGKDL